MGAEALKFQLVQGWKLEAFFVRGFRPRVVSTDSGAWRWHVVLLGPSILIKGLCARGTDHS